MNFLQNIIETLYYFMLDSIDFMKRHALLLVLLFVIFSGIFIAIREFWFFGTVTISANEENFRIFINETPNPKKEDQGVLCKKNTCTLQLFPKKHTLYIQKDGFTPVLQNIDIRLKENTKIFLNLEKNMLEITPTNFSNFLGVTFPLSSSVVSPMVSLFSLHNNQKENTKNVLVYKNTPLFSIPQNNPVFVSTDEIGRNVFIASENTVLQFNTEKRIIEPNFALETPDTEYISAFIPQKDGSYIIEKKDRKTKQKISLENISHTQASPIYIDKNIFVPIKNICKNNANEFVYLGKESISNTNWASLYVNNREKTILENINIYEVSHIECTKENEIKIMMKNKKAYLLSF